MSQWRLSGRNYNEKLPDHKGTRKHTKFHEPAADTQVRGVSLSLSFSAGINLTGEPRRAMVHTVIFWVTVPCCILTGKYQYVAVVCAPPLTLEMEAEFSSARFMLTASVV